MSVLLFKLLFFVPLYGSVFATGIGMDIQPTDSSGTNTTAVPPITTTSPKTTTLAPNTTTVPPTTTTTPTTTHAPTPNTTTTTTTTTPPPTTTTHAPAPNTTTTTTTTTTPPPTTTKPTPQPTVKPEPDRKFDGPSFIGGMILTMGLMAIAFVSWKFYKARTERNYHTL